MTQSEAEEVARLLMAQYGLSDWKFEFDHAKTRCGSCDWDKQVISLSRYFVRMNDQSEIQETVRHEIAHALAGPNTGHGAKWRAIARSIGAIPKPYADIGISLPKERWALVCENCKQTLLLRHRRSLDTKWRYCVACGPNLGKLSWAEHHETEGVL